MPRIRYLKPDFFEDEDIARLPYWVRLLFQGLWVLADREGRLEDRPEHIKIKTFPYDKKIDIEKGLAILTQPKKYSPRPFIIRYQANGERYIQIVNWGKHQKPHHTEKKSEIPAPEKDIQNNRYLTVKEPLFNGECQEGMGKGMGMEKGMGSDQTETYRQKINQFFFSLEEEWIKDLKEAFPTMNIDQELKKAKGWLLSNPHRQKKNFKSFLYRWLAKDDRIQQNKIRLSQLFDQMRRKEIR